MRIVVRFLLYFLLNQTGLAWAIVSTESDVQSLASAEFTLDGSELPPQNSTEWRRLSLPDNWNISRPGQGGFGWYRLAFNVQSASLEVQSIYIRKLSMNASFFVNGQFLASGGSFEEPVARHWNRPLYFPIPPALLKPGLNQLQVRLWAYPNNRGGLGPVELGPARILHPRFERDYFVQTILPQLCNIVIFVQGLIALAIWVRRREEAYYIFFFAFTFLWAIRSTHMFIRDIPVPAFYWDIWVQSSFGWCVVLFNIFALRYSRIRWPWLEICFLIYALLGPFLMFLADPIKLHAAASNWSFFIVPLGIFCEAVLIRTALRSRKIEDALVASVWALVVLAGIHDGLVHRDKLAFDSYYWVSYVMILLCLVVGWQQTNRMVNALNQAEKLNLELEQRVAEKHAELKHSFERVQQMEKDTAVSQERQRIMSEMHDGMGAQLIATLEMVEQGDTPSGAVAGELREALDSLRLTVDSLEPAENDLLSVLANLRYRLEGRLTRQGIALNWQVNDIPKPASLTPQSVLHILRILQEAFTNIVKHARAKTVTVATGFDEQRVIIRISDDGVGIATERVGRGMLNMRRRADALQGTIEFSSAQTGTILSLYLPRSSS